MIYAKRLIPIAVIASLFISTNITAQTWQEMMYDPTVNFYDTQQEFNDYWDGRPIEKGKGYNQFRRWENFVEPRVYPKGNVTDASRAYQEYQIYLRENPQFEEDENNRAANWTPLGPIGAPSGGGAGRLNCVRFDPTDPNTIYVGAPAGGLWKSTDAGGTWTTNTDQLTVIGVTDIAIDPGNTQIMYLATGDGDAGDTYSVGVLKSTDGGTTWNTTGLNWNVNQGRRISKLLMHPSNSQILLAATSNGVYRTTNGGTSWTQTQTGNFKDMEFKPGDPNTVYVAGTTFWRSTDNGVNFTQITSGVPTSGVSRIAIAVTPADANYVYLLIARSSDQGLMGVYRSTNSGTSFTQRHGSSPNLLGWNSNGGDSGGQGWYDLSIAVSNTNRNYVVVGGVNTWRSTNGGSGFSIHTHWTGGGGAPYAHADCHDIVFLPGSGTTYFQGNDGGIYRTTNSGSTWTDLSANLEIAQQYRVGLSSSNSTLLVTGHQDNGTNKLNGATWSEIYGGDGMDCFIDRTNNNRIYASYVYGAYRRSNNGGATWTNITSGLSGTAAWLAPWHQDPVDANTIYAGYSDIFISTNQGTNWTMHGNIAGAGTIREFSIAPSNTNYIYAARTDELYRTTNGGGSWTDVTGSLPVGSAALTDVEVHPTDPQTVWVTFSGYSSGNKIYVTTDGGGTWTNYSNGLPNLPANTVVFQVGSPTEILYVGTDIGVFVRDNTMGTWVPYLTNLPRTVVSDLEIFYGTGTIRAATYGRGTWESGLFTSGTEAPLASFTGSPRFICPGDTVFFTDQSAFSPTSWSWTFPGGTPSSDTVQNPVVVYNTPGLYDVTMVAINANGEDTLVQTGYVMVTGPNVLPLVEGFEAPTFPPTEWGLTDVNGNGNYWFGTTSAGGYGASAQSAVFNNYSTDEMGTQDDMWTPKYDFTGLTDVYMTFDVAYARYNATYSDTLEILVSTDCGETFTQEYIMGGTDLATAPDHNTEIFIPTPTEWRTDSVNLATYIGNGNVMVAFRNHGRYGQVIWVDNVNIQGVGGSAPTAGFSTTATTICEGDSVTYTNTSTGETSIGWDFPGGTPNNGSTSPITIVYNSAGTYTTTLTATNAFGTNTSTAVITVNSNPSASASNTGAYCEGETIQLNSGGGTGFSWAGPASFSSGAQNPTIASSTTANAGTYTVTVTNAAGCSATATTAVTVNTNPTATASNTGAYCVGETIQLNSGGGGSYSWSGPASFSSSSQNPTIPSSTTANAGTYTVTVTNASGCTNTATTAVTVNTNPSPTSSNTGPYCENETIQLNSGGGSSYSWAGPASFSSSSQNPTIASCTVANAGNYTVTATNAAGCTATSVTAVTVNAAPAATASNGGPYCLTQTIQLNSGGGVGYSWSGPNSFSSSSQNPTIPGAAAIHDGVYTVTVTGSNGCTESATTTVTVAGGGSATASNTGPYCVNETISLNTVAGASGYAWSGPASFSSTSQNPTIPSSTTANAGTYTVVVTYPGGCTTSATTAVTVNTNPSAPVITPSGPTTFCPGGNVTLNSSYGSNNTWSTSETTTSILVSAPNTYSVTYTDGNGCTASSSIVVSNYTPPSAPVITPSGPTTFCSGGSVDLSSSYGSGNAWSTSETTQIITVNSGGNYTVTHTDGNGCTASASITVTVNTNPSDPVITASGPTTFCAGGSVTLTSSYGSGNTWSTSETTSSILVNSTGNYIVTYTDGNGCTATASQSVTVNASPSNPVITPSGPTTFCAGDSVTLTSSYGSGNVWSTSETTSGITVMTTGNYTVTYTDGNGCTSTASVSVTVNSLPFLTVPNFGNTCVNYGPMTLTGESPTGGTYSGAGVTGNSFDPSVAGVGTIPITYTYTDGNGCTNSEVSFVDVLACLGVEDDMDGNEYVGVYPNPNEGWFNIIVNTTDAEVYDLRIYNSLGQIVLQENKVPVSNINGTEINLHHVAAGTYHVIVMINGRQHSMKIIKK